MSRGVGHGRGLDLMCLWCRLAAIALIQPLAWEPPYAMGVILKKTENKKKGNHTMSVLRQLGLNQKSVRGRYLENP